jgi:hypothetical protein
MISKLASPRKTQISGLHAPRYCHRALNHHNRTSIPHGIPHADTGSGSLNHHFSGESCSSVGASSTWCVAHVGET